MVMLYRHKKRGTTYKILGPGHVLCTEPFLDDETCEVFRDRSNERVFFVVSPGSAVAGISLGQARVQCEEPLLDGEEIVVYQDVHSGALGVRTRDEFHDGRFEAIETIT